MHVRGFTRHPSSGTKHPGTYAALREKIPYLKDLGVNCVELLPIFEFDEFENSHPHPETGEQLMQYWGYSTVAFFAPKAGYAATGKYGMQVDELKNLIKELHRNDIEPRATNTVPTSRSAASTTRRTTCLPLKATTTTSRGAATR
jgi:isoamylase